MLLVIVILVNGVDIAGTPGAALSAGKLFAPLRSIVLRIADRVETRPGNRIVISRGTHKIVLRVNSRVALRDGVTTILERAPYKSGEDVMIPLRDLTEALHERLTYDAIHRVANVTIMPTPIVLKFTPAPRPLATPHEVFTPRPVKTPMAIVTPAIYPRRTPVPVRLDRPMPPL